MKEYKAHRTMYKKEGEKWVAMLTTYDELSVYKELSNRIIAKKIEQCKWITSIRSINHYNGWKTIYMYYGNGTKDAFLVER